MQAGRLRHRVTFKRKAQGYRDPETGVIVPPPEEWETVTLNGVLLAGVPAEVLTGPGREAYQSQAVWGEVKARINLRWFPVDELELYKWRVFWHTASGFVREFDILSVETDATATVEWRLRCGDGLGVPTQWNQS